MSQEESSKRIKDEATCQAALENLIQEVDKNYQAFANREAPYNRRDEPQSSMFDRNWLSFTSIALDMAKKCLSQMGLNKDEIFNLYRDFDRCFEDEEFAQALKNNAGLYNKPIAEIYNILCRIYKGLSEKYVYVEASNNEALEGDCEEDFVDLDEADWDEDD